MALQYLSRSIGSSRPPSTVRSEEHYEEVSQQRSDLFRCVAESLCCFAWAMGEPNHCRADAGSMLVKRKRDFPLYLYDGPVAYVLVTDAAERIHQAFEAGRRAALAEVGIPTTRPILADEDSPEHCASTQFAIPSCRRIGSRFSE